jgi:hypothetical protein
MRIAVICLLWIESGLALQLSSRSWQRPRTVANDAAGNMKLKNCKLYSSPYEDLRERLDLGDLFDRWRWMQRLLEEEDDPNDTNQILYAVLKSYFDNPGTDEGAPELTSEIKSQMQSLLLADASNRSIVAIDLNTGSTASADVQKRLTSLLPNAEEQEDAVKSLWDVIIEIHGRESVKINEREARDEWNIRCLVARLLIYFDFLSRGL